MQLRRLAQLDKGSGVANLRILMCSGAKHEKLRFVETHLIIFYGTQLIYIYV